jgi:hypothetical protein
MRPPICQSDLKAQALRAHGCMLVSLAYAAREATDGAAFDDAERYILALLKRSGVANEDFLARGTKLTEAQVAYQSAPGFEGRVAPRIRLFRGGSIRGDLIPQLHEGRWAVVAVNYGAIQDAGKGVGSFRGGHGVVVGEPSDGKVTVADPLRRELVRWPVALLERAMETFGTKPWGNGRGEFGIVAPAPTLLALRTRQRDEARKALAKAVAALSAQADQTKLATEERDAARAEANLATEAVAELRVSLAAARARITELENATPVDCTAAIAATRAAIVAAIEAMP